MMDVGVQLGTLPPPGSALEKAGATAQRTAMKVRERLGR